VSVSNPQKSVSVIVVTFNSVERIASCLRALRDEVDSIGGEIIIYDNASGDATVRAVESAFPDVRIIKGEKNIGFAAANNQAVLEADGDHILFANPDLVLDHGSIALMLKELTARPDAGAVTARMRHPDESFQPTCRKLPTMKNIFFSRGSMLGRSGKSDEYTLGDSDEITEVPAAAATCLMLSRVFFEQLGGFDKRFFMFMEDTDLSLRIGEAGKKIYFIPEAGGVHFWGRGAAVSNYKRLWHHHKSVWKYFLKHFPNGFSLLLLPIALLANFILRALLGKSR